MPDEGSVIKLKNHNRSVGVNFVVYVEFDSSTKSMSNCELSSDRTSLISIKSRNQVGSAITLFSLIVSFIHKRQLSIG